MTGSRFDVQTRNDTKSCWDDNQSVLRNRAGRVGQRLIGYDQATPLHAAAWSDCKDSAVALLDNGADIEARSGKLHNNSPAGWAIVAGADSVFELLMDRGAHRHPWFLDDARDACVGRFDQVSKASQEQRTRILSRLERRQP